MPRWTTEVRTDPGIFHELAAWWDAQTIPRSHPYLRSSILGCWEPGFDEPGSTLHLSLLYRDGDLVAGLPLYRARGRCRSMSRAHVEPFDVITIDDDEVVAQIPEWLSRLPMTNLYRVRRESPIMGYLDRQPRWTVTTTFNSSFVDLSSGLDAVKKQMGSKYLRELRRRRRRLAELGSIGFVEHRSGAEAEQLLLAGFELEAAGWKGDRGHAVLHEPTHERWYRSVTEVASDQGWLRVCGMYLDDRLIAFLYNLEIDGHRYGMATTYDESPDVSIYSPGALLHEMVFEKSAGEGVLSYQFGVGDDAWKYEWATDKRQVYDLLLFGAGPTGWALKKARSARQLIRG